MDIEVEVKESTLGQLVPVHLLNFQADRSLQCHYRSILERQYQSGIIGKFDQGMCASCFDSLTVNDHPRLRSGFKRTKKLSTLLEKSKTEKLSKFHDYLLTRYLDSSSHLKVKCPACGFVNKMSVFKQKESLVYKERLLNEVLTMSEEAQPEEAPVSKKKKKKRKKGKDSASDSLIQTQSASLISQSTPAAVASSPSSLISPAPRLSILETQPPPYRSKTPKMQTYRAQTNKRNQKQQQLNKGFKNKKGLQAFLNDNQATKKGSSLQDFLSSL